MNPPGPVITIFWVGKLLPGMPHPDASAMAPVVYPTYVIPPPLAAPLATKPSSGAGTQKTMVVPLGSRADAFITGNASGGVSGAAVGV
jgi:hypothetical protein